MADTKPAAPRPLMVWRKRDPRRPDWIPFVPWLWRCRVCRLQNTFTHMTLAKAYDDALEHLESDYHAERVQELAGEAGQARAATRCLTSGAQYAIDISHDRVQIAVTGEGFQTPQTETDARLLEDRLHNAVEAVLAQHWDPAGVAAVTIAERPALLAALLRKTSR